MTRRERRRRRRERRGRRGPIRRAVSAVVTTVYVAAAAVLLALALSPYLAWAEWRVDLVAQFSAQAAVITGAAVVWWALWRRWGLAAAAVVALGLHGGALVPGRATWASAAEAAQAGGVGVATGPVRVLQYNAYASNRDADAVIGMFLQSDADIASLLEPSYPVLERGFRLGALKGAYPYFDQHPRGVHLAWQYLLSKWPIRQFVSPASTVNPDGPAASAAIAVVVERPGGAFGVVLIHPQSPRNPGRWRQGNELVERTVMLVEQMEAAGLPVVLLADMNSTPSGGRSRMLVARSGLRRCKPLLNIEGTYPASRPWPWRIAIDDVWVSPEVRVTGWQTAGPSGSDHMAVVVDLLVPRGAANAEPVGVDTYESLGLEEPVTEGPASERPEGEGPVEEGPDTPPE